MALTMAGIPLSKVTGDRRGTHAAVMAFHSQAHCITGSGNQTSQGHRYITSRSRRSHTVAIPSTHQFQSSRRLCGNSG
ncbi:hypothetical protein XELAEV_18004459mg [Xenopus laevis]|uniref:Uncharacterized protein n=1 Tax=Xenopus laevis TaxID=8355 RepID=A0A974GYX7_XENLA|nr:hypothetical protein XELAEV_18004459mg [Xenopus laevis]